MNHHGLVKRMSNLRIGHQQQAPPQHPHEATSTAQNAIEPDIPPDNSQAAEKQAIHHLESSEDRLKVTRRQQPANVQRREAELGSMTPQDQKRDLYQAALEDPIFARDPEFFIRGNFSGPDEVLQDLSRASRRYDRYWTRDGEGDQGHGPGNGLDTRTSSSRRAPQRGLDHDAPHRMALRSGKIVERDADPGPEPKSDRSGTLQTEMRKRWRKNVRLSRFISQQEQAQQERLEKLHRKGAVDAQTTPAVAEAEAVLDPHDKEVDGDKTTKNSRPLTRKQRRRRATSASVVHEGATYL